MSATAKAIPLVDDAPSSQPGPKKSAAAHADDATRYALAARGLRKSFRSGSQKVEILKGIDLLIEPGEIALVMGPSGSG
jgi:ABC-type glutathione transport system ATPase component